MKGLASKTALVTGGGGAVGRAICVRLATAGCLVGVLDRSREAAEQTEEQILDGGGRAETLTLDITNYERCQQAILPFDQRHGGVDVLVNCAGYDRSIAFVDSEPKFWDSIIDVNLRGHLNVLHTVLPGMAKRRHGAIVTLSSEAARVGEPGEAVFAACKAGLIALTKSLAREHAEQNIRLNVVSTGSTRVPADVVGAVAFLASDEASFITGQVLSVSGGQTMTG